MGNERDMRELIKIHKSRDVLDVWHKVASWIEREYKISKDRVKLLYRSALLDIKKTLQEAEITENCEIHVLIDSNDKSQIKDK